MGKNVKKNEIVKQQTRKIVYQFDMGVLNKKNRLQIYYKLYNGLFNYIFDEPKRKDNFIRIMVNKNQYVVLRAYELLMNLIFWRVYLVFGYKITFDDFLNYDVVGLNEIADTFDVIISNLIKSILKSDNKNELDNESWLRAISEQISYSIDDLCEIGEKYGEILCDTMGIYQTIDYSKRSKLFKSSMDTVLDDTLPIKQIENQIQNGIKMLKKEILTNKDNCFHNFVKSGQLKDVQLGQMFYAVGPRTNTDKTILPVIMKRNFMRGYSDVREYYVEAVTARDALIKKRLNVSDSGYLSRKMNLLCLDLQIDHDVNDCGTKNSLTITVHTQEMLNLLISKYYLNEKGEWEEILKTDTHLIGKTIMIRSFVCCCLPQGKVCKKCYGSRARRIYGTLIGIFAAIKLANLFSNLNMQAKHFTVTDSVEITNIPIFKKYFRIDGNVLYLRDDINPKHIKFLVNRDEIEEIVENNNIEEVQDVTMQLETLRIVDSSGPEEEIIDVDIDGVHLSFTNNVLSRSKKITLGLDSDDSIIKATDLDLYEPIFYMTLVTNEVSRFMGKLTKIIDSVATNRYSNPSELIQDFLNTLSDSKTIHILLVHLENIVYNLTKHYSNPYKRPDFSQKNPEIFMASIKQGIFKKDLYTGLGFQELKAQFTDLSIFEKHEKGIYDGFFRVMKPKHLIPIDRAILVAYKEKK